MLPRLLEQVRSHPGQSHLLCNGFRVAQNVETVAGVRRSPHDIAAEPNVARSTRALDRPHDQCVHRDQNQQFYLHAILTILTVVVVDLVDSMIEAITLAALLVTT